MKREEHDADDEIDLLKLLMTIWEAKFLILACAIVAGVIGTLFVLNTFPTYQSNAVLQLEQRGGQLALPTAMQDIFESTPESATEVGIMRTRAILSPAVEDLNLDWQVSPRLAPFVGTMMARYRLPFTEFKALVPYARPGENITLALLSVPPGWINQDIMLTVTETGYNVLLPNGQIIAGEPGQLLQDDDLNFSIGIADINAPSGREYTITQVDQGRAIEEIRSNLSISEQSRGSGLLDVRFSGPDPQANVLILNEIIQSYAQQNIAWNTAEAQSSLDFINSRLPLAEQSLRPAFPK